MTNWTRVETNGKPRPLRQFVALRRGEGTNMLNRSKVGRLAREAGLDELAAVEARRYYGLLERYQAESRFDDESADG